jgi:DNA-binding transcriptional regulator YhcF (GntR family)
MLIKINRESSVPIYVQIADCVRDMILKGELIQGYKLPPERILAKELGVNRSTILSAYGELKAEGLVDSHVGQGTIVKDINQNNYAEEVKAVEKIDWKQMYSENALRNKESVSIDILKLVNNKDIISFAAGIANTELDPISKFNEIEKTTAIKNTPPKFILLV